jgi:hypothetical protein
LEFYKLKDLNILLILIAKFSELKNKVEVLYRYKFYELFIYYITLKILMDSKIHAVIISSILAFALIAGIPAAFVNVLAQGEGGNGGGGEGGMTGGEGGMTGGGNMTGGMGGGEGGGGNGGGGNGGGGNGGGGEDE